MEPTIQKLVTKGNKMTMISEAEAKAQYVLDLVEADGLAGLEEVKVCDCHPERDPGRDFQLIEEYYPTEEEFYDEAAAVAEFRAFQYEGETY